MRQLNLVLIVVMLMCNTLIAQTFDYDKIKPHPRLFLNRGEEELIKSTIAQNVELKNIHDRIISECDKIIDEPVMERVMSGKRLLGVSRTVLQRVFRLSYAYRLTGDEKYAKRAEDEMLKATSFSDWNTSHFLDVGEMTLALAIGYDWLYDYLPESSKNIIATAITEKAFDPTNKIKFFYTLKNNWNSVCNGGLVAGALSILEVDAERSKAVIEESVKGNPYALECYAPDGCYPEGYTYWGYGTTYQIMLTEALQTSLGSDNGLSKAAGFMESARYMQFMSTPTGNCFAYSDSTVGANSNFMLYWFAMKANDLSMIWSEIPYLTSDKLGRGEEARFLPFLLVCASKLDLSNIDKVAVPTQKFWSSRGHTPLFIYRSGWSGEGDTYLGIKGGSASASHGHMDAGSFVFEKDGERWSIDLGRQEYLSLESKGVDLWNMRQNSGRWDVFRLGADAHSTITVNGEKHLVKGFADIIEKFETKKCKGAMLDMTEIFGANLESAVRTISLDKRDNLHVVDQITTNDKSAEVSWVMVTPAKAEIIGENKILLKQNGKEMVMSVDAKCKFTLKILSNVSKNDYDHPNDGSCRVGFDAEIEPNKSVLFDVSLRSK